MSGEHAHGGLVSAAGAQPLGFDDRKEVPL